MLFAVLRLNNLKAGNRLNDKSFTSLLKLLKDMLSEDDELSNLTYEAKKIMHSMSVDYEKIQVCP